VARLNERCKHVKAHGCNVLPSCKCNHEARCQAACGCWLVYRVWAGTYLCPEAGLTEQHTGHECPQCVTEPHLLGQQAAATHRQQAGSNERLAAAAVGHHLHM
jgi:hypothetical protein